MSLPSAFCGVFYSGSFLDYRFVEVVGSIMQVYHGILVIDESKRCGVMQKLRLVNHSKCFVKPLKANYAVLLTFVRQLSHYQPEPQKS